jgi:serine O-acetyltransferase
MDQVYSHVARHLDVLFPLENKSELSDIFPTAVERTKRALSWAKEKGYTTYYTGEIHPLHTDQYCMLLYCLSNEAIKRNFRTLAEKLFCLNKTLHAVDIWCEVEMPDVFCLSHPVGAVMGRAKYGNGFCFSQGCTVGNNKDIYPVIGENVVMYAHSMILGNCKIGNNVKISAKAYIKDEDVPDNVIVFGSSPNLVFKPVK